MFAFGITFSVAIMTIVSLSCVMTFKDSLMGVVTDTFKANTYKNLANNNTFYLTVSLIEQLCYSIIGFCT